MERRAACDNVTARPMLQRPRLLGAAAQRWCRRVVIVEAGPGFGKSVLLAQMRAEHLLAPRGMELSMTCTDQDRSPDHFLGRLGDVAGVNLRPGVAAHDLEQVMADLARRWPTGVCLVVDDVHHLTATRAGAQMLSHMVTCAPPPVHFLLAGRPPVRGLSRLRPTGDLVAITEADLRFGRDEITELSRRYGVDAVVVAHAGGWPAVASLSAAYGISGASEYVWDAVLEQLSDAQRKVLAVAATIGRGDGELLRAAAGDPGVDVAAVLAAVPLVDRDGDVFVVHDLWRRVVAGLLTATEELAAVVRAVHALLRRGEYDAAFGLSAANALWDHALDVVTASCDRGHPAVGQYVIEGWLDRLPSDRADHPAAMLLRGLALRMRDPFHHQTTDVLRRAVDSCRSSGNVVGEIAAANELIYVLRNQGRCEEIGPVALRALELHAAGHAQAGGPVALARSMVPEAAGDVRGMLAELDAVPSGALTRGWQSVVEFRRAMGHLALGDEHDMLTAAHRCDELAEGSTLRHVLPLAKWFAGDPSAALQACDQIVADASRTRVDGVALGAFATMVLATAGRLDDAHEQLAATRRAARDGQGVTPLMCGYLAGVHALFDAARGDDDAAMTVLTNALDERPLTDALGWHAAVHWLPLAYVLVPSVRPGIDARPLGRIHRRRMDVARAVVGAREGTGTITHDDLPAPPVAATTVPLPWAMTLAAHLEASGGTAGRELAEWLFGLYGPPARDALRAIGERDDGRLNGGARRLLAAITLAPRRHVRLRLLGPAELDVGGVPASGDWARDRVRSLLAHLTMHAPTNRDQVIDALWPDLDPDAANRNLRVTLTYLNRVLEPDRRRGEAPFLIRQSGSTLDVAGPPHLHVDVHQFESLIDEAYAADRAGTPSVALGLLEQAIGLWRGPCLSEVRYDDWAQPFCRRLDDEYVRAVVRAAELHLAAGRHADVRRLARRALEVDQWSEAAYRLLISAALADGDRVGAARAVEACEAMLADIGLTPDAQTVMLRRRLQSAPSTEARSQSARAS